MKLFLIERTTGVGYDEYDSAVVCAADENVARNMNPRDGKPMTTKDWTDNYPSWESAPERVKVTYLGESAPDRAAGVICASFNAG